MKEVSRNRYRHSIRLKGYDYSQPGAYYFTVCIQERACLLELDPVKTMVEQTWRALESRFTHITLDEFAILPNHIHGIIIINNLGTDQHICSTPNYRDPGEKQITGDQIASPLHRIIQWYKTMTTNYYIQGVKNRGWLPFSKRLWQRNYYEHVIRNDEELNQIREYIRENSMKWEFDSENPKCK